MAAPAVEGYSDLVEVGEGGFARVYRATRVRFGQAVALKILKPKDLDDRARRLFERECLTMGRLSWHPNVVAVYDSGFTADGSPYLALEYLDRGSLADRLSRQDLPWESVVDVGVQVAGALGAVHQAGTVHRDVKPENLLIGPFGEVKLADFGIAAFDQGSLSSVGGSSFTPHYVAPEVLRSHRPDARSDVYSLAATLHCLIDGRPPFAGEPGEPVGALLVRVLEQPAPRLTDAPDDLADLVEAGLAKDPEARPASAEVFGEALQAVQRAHDLPVTALRIQPESEPEAAPAEREPESEADPAEPEPEPERAPEPAEAASEDGEGTVELHGASAPRPAPPAEDDGDEGELTVQIQAPTPALDERREGTEPERRGGSRRRWPVVVGAAAVLALLAGLILVVTGDGADHVTANIGTGFHPSDVVVGEGAVFVSSESDDTSDGVNLARVGAADLELTLSEGQGGIDELAVGAGKLWAAEDLTVLRYDAAEPAGASFLTLNPDLGGENPRITGLAFGSDQLYASVASDAGGRVFRIDPVEFEVVGDNAILEAQDLDFADGSLWVTAGSDAVERLGPALEDVAVIDVPGGPGAVAASADDGVWVTTVDDDSLVRIDPAVNEVVATVDVGGAPGDLAVGEGAVWATVGSDLVRVDPATNEVTDRVDMKARAVAVAVGEGAVWVVNDLGRLRRIDPDSF